MKSFFTLRENTQVTEAVTVSRKDFDSLKKGDKVTITFDSSIRKGNTATYVIKGKSRSAKYNVDKISMQPEGKPGVQKSFLYSRDGKDATMAQGDMGVTMTKFVKESVELDERNAGKSATGYDIYHDTYAAAMQHAYAHAKKKHGVTVRPSEIDDKVALGPKKPSSGKTVSHILKTDKKQNLHVQVYNTGRKYELNMYVESVELEENQTAFTRKELESGNIIIRKDKNGYRYLINKSKNGAMGPYRNDIQVKTAIMKIQKESVELDEAPKVPDGMKFLGAYEYKDANGKYHSHRHYSKGGKMNSPVVVYIDDKEWETFQSFTKARKAAINHIKGMKESVEEAKVRGADAYDKTFANRKQADKFAREMGGRVKQVGRVFYVFKEDVDEATILRTKTTRKQSDASKEKDKEKAVKTFQDIRKGKYPGVKIGEETLDEASIQDIQGILTTIAKSQNMNQAVQMVVKKYKVDQGKAKAMVKKAIDSGVTYDKIKKKYAKEDVDEDMSKFSANRPVSVKLGGKKVDVHQKDGKHHVSVDGKSLGSHDSQKAAMSAASRHIYVGK